MRIKLKQIASGIAAAVTSPEAIKQERSLAALIVTRTLLAIGAGDALVQLAQKIIGG